MGLGSGVLSMKRYVVVDADGFVENVILWDGVTPFSEPRSLVTESKCKAKRRPEPVQAATIDESDSPKDGV